MRVAIGYIDPDGLADAEWRADGPAPLSQSLVCRADRIGKPDGREFRPRLCGRGHRCLLREPGYACTAQQPSTKAVGFLFRGCRKVDEAGRARIIDVVTDPDGRLADGIASVQGKEGEAFLAPTDALEPLAGFLGAMLGEGQGSTLLMWLAGHLGDGYAETTIGAIRVATYTDSKEIPPSSTLRSPPRPTSMPRPPDRRPRSRTDVVGAGPPNVTEVRSL